MHQTTSDNQQLKDKLKDVYYFAFCYLLFINLLPYYYGILHGYPCYINNLCLHHVPTRDQSRGLLIASPKPYRLSYAGV